MAKPSDLDLQCFQKAINLNSAGHGLKSFNACIHNQHA